MTDLPFPKTKAMAEAILAAWDAHQRNTQALGRTCNVARATMRDRIWAAQAILGVARQSRAPVVEPSGMISGKSTVQYDAAGNLIQEWRRIHPDRSAIEAMRDAFLAGIPKLDLSFSKKRASDTMLEITIGDHHFGMRSWGQETGADWDLDIAQDSLLHAVARLLQAAGTVRRIRLALMGDFLHYDMMQAQTARGGHVLDADGRYPKVVRQAVRLLLAVGALCGGHCRELEWVVIPGNHDEVGVVWIRELLNAAFQHKESITVIMDPAPQVAMLWNKILLAYCHGDKTTPQRLASLMPALWPDKWAASTHRRWRTGHWHHQAATEYPGLLYEVVPILAPRDAYAAGGAYLSRRTLAGYLWGPEDLIAKYEIAHRDTP